mmetsp:Transcript_14083/g.15742  ORF Transcript_14083/g.15742 Transcript_14083/m.15742 type:complete len:551 (-) Transcript_14083:41-1693(-)|eukprot:CAMPEP_0205821162 /NCGR_PEP_ID=MMETSP0206-20130828/5520_1 /ASSEMBLY_ACC=CAM_ASM_000279 /TAXON_ID=36767 /ORGANISM="Euplotes focardii, Strain TN1" /LENGTH=550 /DNA_ID=CAMNT_0053116421 /DNA_START=16 /DNA_END=1668 /DNA_ORIENTATION=+
MPSKEKGGIDTDDIRGMISKWASIPFGIVTVLVAGGALNLIPLFLDLKDQLGFEPIHQEFIRWGVLFGYFGGILAGPLVDLIGTTISFLIAAVIAGGGFVGLAFYTDSASVGTLNVIIIIVLVLLVSFACAIASIAAIATVIKNFSRNVGAMVASVMIAYYFAAPYFDTSIRRGYFDDIDLKINMIASGAIHFIVYILAAFIVDENEQSSALKRASSLTDRFGVLVYAVIAGLFLAGVYITCIIAEAYQLSIVFFTIIILANFIVLAFTVQALIGQINNSGEGEEDEIPPKMNFGQMFIDIRYWCLLIGTFIVVGTGSTYYIEAGDVAGAVGNPDLGDKVDYAYWLSAAIAILGGGLIASIFNSFLNAWLFAAIAAFSSMLGFGLVFLSETNDIFFYASAFFVGAGTGGWWVIVPQIILDDAGPKSFESLWGLTLTVNAAGIFVFERLFWWISEKTEPTEAGSCDGIACYLIPYVASGILCLIAGILAIVAWNNDVGTGGAGGEERKSLRKNDANSEGRRSKSGKRDKSEKKGKSSKKSKSKSKSKDKKR